MSGHICGRKCFWKKGNEENVSYAAAKARLGYHNTMSRVIWQKAALQSCHPPVQWMHSSAMCAGQAHSPAVAGKQCRIHRYITMGRQVPSKVPPSCWALDPYLIYGSFGSHEATPQTASRLVQPYFWPSLPVCQTHSQTDRPTDHATCDVCSSMLCPMHCMRVMQPKNQWTQVRVYEGCAVGNLQSVFVNRVGIRQGWGKWGNIDWWEWWIDRKIICHAQDELNQKKNNWYKANEKNYEVDADNAQSLWCVWSALHVLIFRSTLELEQSRRNKGGLKCPCVHTCMYVRPQKVSSI